jgi:hypothetical protein
MSGHRIKLVREVKVDDKNDKLAPQEQVIYDALLKKGVGKEIDRDSFVEELEKSGTLKTKQETRRVVAYYLQHLTKIGVAESIKPEPVAKEEKPKAEKKAAPAGDDKPAKPASPAAAGAAPKPAQAQA